MAASLDIHVVFKDKQLGKYAAVRSLDLLFQLFAHFFIHICKLRVLLNTVNSADSQQPHYLILRDSASSDVHYIVLYSSACDQLCKYSYVLTREP